MLISAPFTTNTIQGVVIGCLSVLTVETFQPRIDFAAVARVAIICLLRGPVLTYWVRWCSRQEARLGRLILLLMDQLLMSPFLNVAHFSLDWALRGNSPAELPGRLLAKVPRAMATSYCFWVPVRYLSMRCPSHLTLLLMNAAGFVWSIVFFFFFTK
jgi:hypothetical protein